MSEMEHISSAIYMGNYPDDITSEGFQSDYEIIRKVGCDVKTGNLEIENGIDDIRFYTVAKQKNI